MTIVFTAFIICVLFIGYILVAEKHPTQDPRKCSLGTGYENGEKKYQIICRQEEETPKFCLLDEYPYGVEKYCIFCGEKLKEDTK